MRAPSHVSVHNCMATCRIKEMGRQIDREYSVCRGIDSKKMKGPEKRRAPPATEPICMAVPTGSGRTENLTCARITHWSHNTLESKRQVRCDKICECAIQRSNRYGGRNPRARVVDRGCVCAPKLAEVHIKNRSSSWCSRQVI